MSALLLGSINVIVHPSCVSTAEYSVSCSGTKIAKPSGINRAWDATIDFNGFSPVALERNLSFFPGVSSIDSTGYIGRTQDGV